MAQDRERSCYLLGLLDHAITDLYAPSAVAPNTVNWHDLIGRACHYGPGVRPQEFDQMTQGDLYAAWPDHYGAYPGKQQ